MYFEKITMKKIFLILFIFTAFSSNAQWKYHIGLYRYDSLYANLFNRDTSTIKPVGVDEQGKFGKLPFWAMVGGGSNGWLTSGNSASFGSFIGTTNSRSFRFRTNNTERMNLDSLGNLGLGANPIARFHLEGSFAGATTTNNGNARITLNLGADNSPLLAFHIGKSTGTQGAAVGIDFATVDDAIFNYRFLAGRGTGGIADAFMLMKNKPFGVTSAVDYALATPYFYIATDGRIGIGTNSPSAVFHIAAGTNVAGSAPFKFTDGTQLATPESLVVEPETGGANLLFTNQAGSRYTLAKTLTNTATLDFPSTLTQESSDLTITVTGAAVGDVVSVGVPNGSVVTNTSFSAWVSATDTVTVRLNNYSAGSANPSSGTFRVSVIKY